MKGWTMSGGNEEEVSFNTEEKVLGVIWKPATDQFYFKVKVDELRLLYTKDEALQLTKRKALSIVNGLFDPLGLASPYTIKLKLFMKDTLSIYNP